METEKELANTIRENIEAVNKAIVELHEMGIDVIIVQSPHLGGQPRQITSIISQTICL